MPELPDVTVYVERLDAYLTGHAIEGARIRSPSLVKTYDPPIRALVGRTVTGFRRIGKRIVMAVEPDLYVVLHLMIAGRLKWRPPAAAVPRKRAHGALDFDHGTLLLTEASAKKRMTLHVVRGDEALAPFDRGGLEVLDADLPAFGEALLRENHTLKRALTDPRLLSGIGGAYADEILHRAQLSPIRWTSKLEPSEIARLFDAARGTLSEWTERTRAEVGDSFPEKVTAFRQGMAVHGRHGEPCPACAAPVQRIVYVGRETNYCAACQTGGKLLKDRALSRLLHDDWPRTLDELEQRAT